MKEKEKKKKRVQMEDQKSPYMPSPAPETTHSAKRLEYDDGGNIVYIGTAIAAAADTDPKWRIEKLEYGEHGVVRNYFPKMPTGQANSYYNFKWSDRGTYEYA